LNTVARDRITLRPGSPRGAEGATGLQGRIEPPGDKSITHRAYLFAALADGESRVANPNPGLDCLATLECLEALGVLVARTDDETVIRGRAMRFAEPERVLDCGNSGTTLRLLSGPLAAQPFLSILQGDESLNRRPVRRIVEPLRQMGATLSGRSDDRYPPLVIRGAKLSPREFALNMPSAQVASAILLAGLFAEGVTRVELPGLARDHTERLLKAFGVTVAVTPRPNMGPRLEVQGPVTPAAASLRVPGDFSAAAFFLALAAATPGGSITAENVSLNPTRTGLLDALEAMGAKIDRANERDEAGEPIGDVTVTGPERLRAFAIPPEWVPRMIDEAPAWALAAANANGRSVLSGAGELRHKESDRIALLARNLGVVGISAREREDGIEIEGGRPRGGLIDAEGDHRIAMAFAALSRLASDAITIQGAGGIATSYPRFLEVLASLGGGVDETLGAGRS
jgi:3-phosphoshikimate 1-carboxyvinyltransferase